MLSLSAHRKLVLLALAAWHNKIISEITISTCFIPCDLIEGKDHWADNFIQSEIIEQLKCKTWIEQCSFEEQ